MSATGEVRVEGSELVYLDANGVQRSYEGAAVRSWRDTVGNPLRFMTGRAWVDGSELHYVDEEGEERALSGDVVDSTDGVVGSLWIEGADVAYVTENREKAVLDQGITPADPDSPVDLWIDREDIYAEVRTVAAGETVDLHVTYENVGGTGTEIYRTYVGDRLVEEQEFEIEAGRSGSTQLPVRTEPGDEGAESIRLELANTGIVATESVDVVAPFDSDANVRVESFDTDRDYATPGETVEYSGTITNTNQSGSVWSRLYLGETMVFDREYSMDANQTNDGTNTVDVTADHVGAELLHVEFVGSGNGARTQLEVVDGTDANPLLWSVDVSSSELVAGESVDVTAGIGNSETGTEVVRVSVGDRIVHEESVELTPDGPDELTYTVDTELGDAGAQRVTVQLLGAGQSESASVDVVHPCDGVEVDGLAVESFSAPDRLQVGESGTVEAKFLQCGQEDLYSPSIVVGDETVWSAFETVGRGQGFDPSVEIVPQAGDWGETTVRAESRDDAVEQSLRIEPAPFAIELADPPSLTGDDTLSTTATIRNEGAARDVQPVELRVDGEVRDSGEVELDAGERTTVELATSVSPGEHEVVVATASHEVATSADVEEPGPELSVSLGDVRDPVTHATSALEVPATVTSESGEEVAVDVTVHTGAGSTTEQVTLSPDGQQTVRQSVAVDPDPEAGLDVEVSVASADSGEELATATSTLSVAEPLDVTFGDNEPRPDGEDGRYRDFTGDGTVGQTDVVEFFRYQHRDGVQERPAYFDYSGNGDVTHGDVVALFEYVATGPI